MQRMILTAVSVALLLLAGCSKNDTDQTAAQPAATEQQAPEQETSAPVEAEKAVAEAVEEAVESGEGEAVAEPQASKEIRLAQPAPAPLATRFVAGKHYTLLNPAQPTSSAPGQIEVAEFFMYTCPHCYNFEPFVQTYLSKKPADVNFIRVPTVFNQTAQLHARAFYTAEVMGILETTHYPMFKAIHVDRNMLASEEAIIDLLTPLGVNEAEFRKNFNSFAVDTKMRQGATMARRFQISSVPNVIVNGKYLTGGAMAGSYETLLEIIDELVMIERTR